MKKVVIVKANSKDAGFNNVFFGGNFNDEKLFFVKIFIIHIAAFRKITRLLLTICISLLTS